MPKKSSTLKEAKLTKAETKRFTTTGNVGNKSAKFKGEESKPMKAPKRKKR